MAPVATDFVKVLAESQLLDELHLEELSQLAPAYPDASTLATELVRRGWLTSYQLAHLERGNPEDLLIGPYVVLDEVGQGGMGKVYQARHRRLDRIVALKVINPLAISTESVLRFQREARAIARLKHPNIVMLYDADEVDGKHFLALEFIEGVDLDKMLQQRGPFPIHLACDCIRQAALGLQHAHERGLVHRDVKPSNLVLTRGADMAPPMGRLAQHGDAPDKELLQDGVVKILDLGLARLYPLGTAPVGGPKLSIDGFVVGTPDYLAPEQALDSHTVDIRADIYSLGCTFYELLTGTTPFADVANGTQKLLSHLQDQPPAVEKLRKDVPAGVVAIVRKMMAKNPRDRFQAPGQVAEALAFFAKPRSPAIAADSTPPPTVATPARELPRSETAGVSARVRQNLSLPKARGMYADEPKELTEHEGAVRCTAFSPDGKYALSGGEDHAVYLWDVLGAKKVRRLAGHTDAVLCVTFAPDGRTAVSGGSDRTINIWEVETGQQLARFKGQTGEVCTAAFSPDGKLLLTGGKDQALHLWDLATRRYLRQLGGVVRGRHYDTVEGVAFAPDGVRALSVSQDKTMRLWNVPSGRELHCFDGHTDKVFCVAYSPDGIHVASGGRDRTVRLWGVVSGQELQRFEGHTRSVRGVVFSPGGQHLLTGGDTTIRLWEVASGRQVYSSTANSIKVLCVAMTADAAYLLSGGVDGVVRLWGQAL
jgi:serine/threonine protein kinase